MFVKLNIYLLNLTQFKSLQFYSVILYLSGLVTLILHYFNLNLLNLVKFN